METNERPSDGKRKGRTLEECGPTLALESVQIITHAAEQVKPYSYRAEALLARFTGYQEWKRRRRLKERE